MGLYGGEGSVVGRGEEREEEGLAKIDLSVGWVVLKNTVFFQF